MPWHAVPYTSRHIVMALEMTFSMAVKGIPSVVLLNGKGALIEAPARERVMAPRFPSTLPRVCDVEEILEPPAGPVEVQVIHQRQAHDTEPCIIEVDADEGWETLRILLFSITEIPVEQQRLFGLGIEKGPLSESVPLAQALARGVLAQKNSGEPEKPPVIYVLGNFSCDDPFEVAGAAPPAQDIMIKEQQLAFLQVKLMSSPPRLQNQASSLQHVFQYEDLALQRQALDQIPVCALFKRALEPSEQAEGFELAFMRKLLHWFKHEFFTWTNAPRCEHCGSTDTVGIGGTQPNQIEQSYGAGSVEVASCNKCGGVTRFPRYNDPSKLLETRQGRCGEWANCFTLICRALGYEARHVHDWTDHVWTEIYSDSLKRWVHLDSCEAALDVPLIYEQGWGKKLTYCIAFARDNVRDVTERYTKKYNEVLTRRTEFPEEQLRRVMVALDEFATDSGVSNLPPPTAEERRKVISQRSEAETKEFAASAADLKAEEQVGRTSGDQAWREQRGELGANADAKARAIACSETGIKVSGAPPVPGSWSQSAENYSFRDGVLYADLRCANGMWKRGLSITVEPGASYSNQDGSFSVETTTLHQFPSINSSAVSDDVLPHQCVAAPHGLETVTISCQWKDQGFGNMKGRLKLEIKRGDERICSQDCFGLAPHALESRSKTFTASELQNPRGQDIISIGYVVGGGGGHQLFVDDLKISLTRKPQCNGICHMQRWPISRSSFQWRLSHMRDASSPNISNISHNIWQRRNAGLGEESIWRISGIRCACK
jgi:hypothetical protein